MANMRQQHPGARCMVHQMPAAHANPAPPAPSPVLEERKRELSRNAKAMRQLLHSR